VTQVEPQGSPDAPLDLIAAILRALAQHGSAHRPQAASDLETWARHVLLLLPPPRKLSRPSSGERDWLGLRHFVVGHIRDEGVASAQAVGDVQEALWAVIEGMSHAILADAKDDDMAVACIERLRDAAARSPEDLKEIAFESAALLGELMRSRAARHQSLARELGERVDRLRSELDEARREADLDGLTQLGNRSVLERELERSWHLHALTGESYWLLLIDVDRFKAVNDTFGHQAGDEALRAISNALAFGFPRRSDVVCRFGGDEFAVILRDASLAEAERLAGRFLDTIRELEIDSGPACIRLTVSIGLADVTLVDTAATWLGRADRALYAAKQAGRDRVAVPPAPDERRAA
jgi:diguanylate cyclase (GGDEF)-like protein